MSFNFGDINPPGMKAQSAYKDGSGMGGGGMYFKQKGKRKEEPDEDLFEHSSDKNEDEIDFGNVADDEIPQDSIVNKFVNWFRINKD
ncbi:hypothetical protein IKQ21_01600 [bacterium]|nr:hypothetical protein [bacterium]